jgi:hypothetical protein
VKDVLITEGIEGTWHYHLSTTDNKHKSLCGKPVMHSNLSMNDWGFVSHLKEKYCEKCMKTYKGTNG